MSRNLTRANSIQTLAALVGTSPNVIVARVRGELGGEPFGMFDFTPVGIGIALVGCAFLSLAYRLLPKDRQGSRSLDQAVDIKDYVTEARIPEKAALAGKTVADLRKPGDGEVEHPRTRAPRHPGGRSRRCRRHTAVASALIMTFRTLRARTMSQAFSNSPSG